MGQDTVTPTEAEIGGKVGEGKNGTFKRVKERFSMRKKKSDKKVECKEDKDTQNNGDVVVSVDKEGEQDTKKTSFVQKVIDFFSKKKKNKQEEPDDVKVEEVIDEVKDVPTEEPKEPSIREPDPSPTPSPPPPRPITPASKPPVAPRAAFLAGTGRPPSSATASQSRPISQLDVALKQFKESTMASRENLRISQQDLREVEQVVNSTVRQSSLSRNNSLRRSTGQGTTIPITLSNSLADLRQRDRENIAKDRASLCVN